MKPVHLQKWFLSFILKHFQIFRKAAKNSTKNSYIFLIQRTHLVSLVAPIMSSSAKGSSQQSCITPSFVCAAFFKLKHYLSFSLTFRIFISLRTTGQSFCRISLSLSFSGVSLWWDLVVHLRQKYHRRDTCFSYSILSGAHNVCLFIVGDGSFDLSVYKDSLV